MKTACRYERFDIKQSIALLYQDAPTYKAPNVTDDRDGHAYVGMVFESDEHAISPSLFAQVANGRFTLVDALCGNRQNDNNMGQPFTWAEFKLKYPNLTYIGRCQGFKT